MTEKEKQMICDLNNAHDLEAAEIGELMRMASTCEGSNKLGNVLFDAITKSFALGYIRGSKKKKVMQYILLKPTILSAERQSFLLMSML